MALCGFKCSTACHWGDFVSSWVFPESLRWLCVIASVSLSLIRVSQCHPRCPTVAHWGGSTSSQISHCISQGCLCINLGVSLLLNRVVPCCSRCFTATYCCVPLRDPRCHLLLTWVTLCCPYDLLPLSGLVLVIPGVPLLLAQ